MTDGTPDREVLDTAQGLTAALANMAAEVKRLRAYGRYNRKFILVDIALTILLTIFGYLSVHAANQANDAGQAAAANHANLIAACEAGNQNRAEQVQLWDHLGALALNSKHTTATQRKADEQLLAYVRRVFAPRPCQQVYATSRPGK